MKLLSAAILALALQQPNCNISNLIDSKSVDEIRKYFPRAEVTKVLPCVLSVETGVPGDTLSRELLTQIAHKLFQSRETMGQLTTGMTIAGYNYFILGFYDHAIVYDRFGGRYYVFNGQEVANFFRVAPNVCMQQED
ncbi:MAG: hypothetical protein ACREI9_04625 [Nitrospiraceae bacterium]